MEGTKMYSPTEPHFFKPLLSDFHQGLLIPVEFSKYLSLSKNGDESGDHNGVLRTECGEWKVRIKGWRFQDGWPDFAKHHDLQVGDFVVFRHQGDLVFDVSVFGPNTCNRQYYSNNFVNPETGMPLPNNHHCTVPPKEGASSSTHPSFQAVLQPYSIKHSEFYIPQEFSRLNGLCNRGCETMTIIDGEKRSWQVSKRETTSHRIYFSNGWRDFRVANALRVGDHLSFTLTENGKTPVMVFSKVNTISSSMKKKPKEVASTTSNCFISVMSTSIIMQSGLYIPGKIVKSNGLGKGSQVTITDPEQRQWAVGLRCNKSDSSARIQIGWRNVALANQLKTGDVIKSELVKRGDNTFAMNLSILGRSSGESCIRILRPRRNQSEVNSQSPSLFPKKWKMEAPTPRELRR